MSTQYYKLTDEEMNLSTQIIGEKIKEIGGRGILTPISEEVKVHMYTELNKMNEQLRNLKLPTINIGINFDHHNSHVSFNFESICILRDICVDKIPFNSWDQRYEFCDKIKPIIIE